MRATIDGVVDLPVHGATYAPHEGNTVSDKSNEAPKVRAVILLPEDARSALRSAALDAGVDMGDLVLEVLLTDVRFTEALERVRRKRQGGEERKSGRK